MTDLVRRRLRDSVEKFLRHQNKTRRAKSALERTIFNEGLLDWMKLVALGNPLDSDHFGSIDKSSEIQAAAHSQTIHQRRAAATESLSAAFSAAKQTEITTQHIDEGLMRRDVCCDRSPIQRKSDRSPVSVLHHSFSRGRPCTSRNARNTRSGVSGISIMRTPVASNSAFPIAGETENMPVSPIPRAPNGPCRSGTSTSSPVSSLGRSSMPGIL